MGAGQKAIFRTALTYNDLGSSYTPPKTFLEDQPGEIRPDFDPVLGYREFLFVTLDAGSANLVAGDVVVMKNVGNNTVTSVFASSVNAQNGVAGVAIGALTAGNKGWIQVTGQHTGVNTTGSTFAVGDQMIHSGTDKRAGKVVLNTAPTNRLIGYATAATVGNLTAANLQILRS